MMASRKAGPRVLACLALACAAHLAAVAFANRPVRLPDAPRVASLSFSPNARGDSPERGDIPDAASIASDLATVHAVTDHVRTYTVSDNMDTVPGLADKAGMTVGLGVWVDDHDHARTDREFATASALARSHRSVTEIYLGNETLLRGDSTPAELASLMRRMHAETGLPVSTAEPWDVWLEHPELAADAGFIAAHVLPYWEDVAAGDTVATALSRYGRLRAAFPGKRIVIAEFGWPSAKFNRGPAKASLINEAAVVRGFVAVAAARGIEYNVIEAFDQPWKTNEGPVGAYWGIFDADRHLKFALTGPVVPDPLWSGKAAAGILSGAAIAAWFLRRRDTGVAQALAISAGAQATGFGLARAMAAPLESYGSPGLMLAWLASIPLLALLAATTFDRMRELSDVLLGPPPGRLFVAGPRGTGSRLPMVSIHVPACNENPSVVAETLESLAALDYPYFEVLAVVNNTADRSLVEPVRQACLRLGDRFRFVDLPRVTGFKAGALNAAAALTSPLASIIAVVDADYVVEPGWLADMVPAFDDPRVALVQAPQEHRDQGRGWLHRAMNAEYAGFFDTGMVERNQDDAIVAHGTMVMVRRSAFEQVGGWHESFITEDTELGLRLFEAGWSAAYTTRRYGRGLLPDTLRSYRRQRDRWAYGAMRIMLAHWRHLLPGSATLTPAQKYHFATGWLHWAGDAVAVSLAAANLGWVAWMNVTGTGEPPAAILTVSTAVAASMGLVHMFSVYAARVRRGTGDAMLAALAGVSLQLTVARAVFSGLLLANLPFLVTSKGGTARTGWGQFTRGFGPELLFGAPLAAAAAWTAWNNGERVFELDAFAAILAIQSVPFLAAFALGVAEFSGTGLAAWRGRERAPASRPAEAPMPGMLADTGD